MPRENQARINLVEVKRLELSIVEAVVQTLYSEYSLRATLRHKGRKISYLFLETHEQLNTKKVIPRALKDLKAFCTPPSKQRQRGYTFMSVSGDVQQRIRCGVG